MHYQYPLSILTTLPLHFVSLSRSSRPLATQRHVDFLFSSMALLTCYDLVLVFAVNPQASVVLSVLLGASISNPSFHLLASKALLTRLICGMFFNLLFILFSSYMFVSRIIMPFLISNTSPALSAYRGLSSLQKRFFSLLPTSHFYSARRGCRRCLFPFHTGFLKRPLLFARSGVMPIFLHAHTSLLSRRFYLVSIAAPIAGLIRSCGRSLGLVRMCRRNIPMSTSSVRFIIPSSAERCIGTPLIYALVCRQHSSHTHPTSLYPKGSIRQIILYYPIWLLEAGMYAMCGPFAV